MVLQTNGVLLHRKQKGKQAAHAQTNPVTPAEAVGADNAGHPVMLKPQNRKRQAEQEEEEAPDTLQGAEQQALAEVRPQEGQEEQDGTLTLEQRVNALQLQHQPATGKQLLLGRFL